MFSASIKLYDIDSSRHHKKKIFSIKTIEFVTLNLFSVSNALLATFDY